MSNLFVFISFLLTINYSTAFSVDKIPQIIKGTAVSKGRWPEFASVQLSQGGTGFRHICGGVIYNNSVVITAARCMENWSFLSPMRVQIGISNILNNDAEQTLGVTSFKKHPSYDRGTGYADDITLLVLNETIRFNQYVKTAVLVTNLEETFVGKECFMTGFGYVDDSEEVNSALLREAPATVIAMEVCKKRLPFYMRNNVFSHKQVCTHDSKQNHIPCKGDYGGPLYCREVGEMWKVCGIASYTVPGTFSNCMEQYPALFTNVANYNKFITG